MLSPRVALRLYLERRFGITRRPLHSECLRGHDLTVIGGSVRVPDYDDAWLAALADNSRIVYDVGPNIGQSTLLVLTSRTTEQVVLIEPNPVALGIAAENIFRNGFSQRTRFICAFAAASSGGKVKFYTVGFGSAGSAIRDFASTASASNTSLEVPNISLDDILAETGLLPDLVKIDVEGSEAGVLAGSVEIARKLRTTFIVEMHAGASLPMSDNAQMVMSWCDSVSYRAWYLKEHRPLASPDDIAGRGRCHLLLLPGDSTYPEYLRGIPQSGPLV